MAYDCSTRRGRVSVAVITDQIGGSLVPVGEEISVICSQYIATITILIGRLSAMATGRVLRSVVAKLRAGVGLVPSRVVCDFAPLPRQQWSPNFEFRSARRGFSSFADSSWYREDEGDDQSVDAFQQHLADQLVQAHAPDWLPLVPGSAYWIHRSSLGEGGSSTERRADIEAELRRAGNLVDMSDEEKMATWTPTGWPAENSISRGMRSTRRRFFLIEHDYSFRICFLFLPAQR